MHTHTHTHTHTPMAAGCVVWCGASVWCSFVLRIWCRVVRRQLLLTPTAATTMIGHHHQHPNPLGACYACRRIRELGPICPSSLLPALFLPVSCPSTSIPFSIFLFPFFSPIYRLLLGRADHVPCHVPERGSSAAPSLFKGLSEYYWNSFVMS